MFLDWGRRLVTQTEFIKKWKLSTLNEESSSQEHFLDICKLIGHKTPAELDPEGKDFRFEKRLKKIKGSGGSADAWKKGFFGWEYKSHHKSLNDAKIQLNEYARDLDNPPLLIVSDMKTIRIYTNFTNTTQKIYDISIDDLYNSEKLNWLRWAFEEPKRLHPKA
jgi:hypothetical protein